MPFSSALIGAVLSVPLQLAVRTDSPSCWAIWRDYSDRTVCVDKSAWREWLVRGGSPDAWSWDVRSRLRSELVNRDVQLPKRSEASITVRSGALDRPREPMGWAWVRRVERLRETLSERLAPHDGAGIFRSLLLGERLTADRARWVRAVGWVHLLNPSGIHLYAHAAWAGGMALFVGRVLGWRVASARNLGAIVATAIFGVTGMLGGLRPGVLRPLILVGCRLGARRLGFRWTLFSPLILALFIDGIAVVLFGEHWGHGAALYALAVGGGVFGMSSGSRLRQHLALSIGSWALLALGEAWVEGRVAPWTPVLSLVSVPVIASISLPALLVPGPWLQGVTSVFGMVSEGLLCSETALWLVDQKSIALGGVLAALAVALGLRTRGVVAFTLAIVSVASFVSRVPPPGGAARVVQLDVGQGDAALVGSDSGWGLWDLGSAYSLSEWDWFELLAERGVDRVDWVGISHLDEDHAGGLARLARVARIGCVAVPRGELESHRGRRWLERVPPGILVQPLERGTCVPYDTRVVSGRARRNGTMGAVAVPLADGRVYINSGDAPVELERRLIPWALLRAREAPGGVLLKVSHHGSKTSTSAEWLRALRPREAWISAGVGNRYHHPAGEVVERLRSLRIPIRRTDEMGYLEE